MHQEACLSWVGHHRGLSFTPFFLLVSLPANVHWTCYHAIMESSMPQPASWFASSCPRPRRNLAVIDREVGIRFRFSLAIHSIRVLEISRFPPAQCVLFSPIHTTTSFIILRIRHLQDRSLAHHQSLHHRSRIPSL